VPYPYAAADHQRKNAREIKKTGAALYVEDADLTADFLITTIEDLISNSEKLKCFCRTYPIRKLKLCIF